jgi:hypothetical protein
VPVRRTHARFVGALVALRFLVLFGDGTQLVQQGDGVSLIPGVALAVSRYGKRRDGHRLLRDLVQRARPHLTAKPAANSF